MSEQLCPVCGNPCLDNPQSKWVCRCCGAEVLSVPIRRAETNSTASVSDVGQHIFDLMTADNKVLAEFYRLNPPHGR